MVYFSQPVRSDYAHQAGIQIYLWHREQGFRLCFTGFFAIAVSATSGVSKALIFTGTLLTLELLIFAVCRPYLIKRYVITRGRFAVLMAVNLTASLAYLTPAFHFLQLGTVPYVTFGVLWIAGVAIYTASTYSAIPVTYWANFFPSLVALPLGTYLLYLKSGSDGLSTPWVMALVGSLVYIYTCVNVLIRQQDTLRQLNRSRREAEDRAVELEFLSQFDQLSGLANRFAFDQKLGSILRDQEKAVHKVAVFLMDLDHFKPINDSYGHDVGDQVLREVGLRLRDFTVSRGFAARLGGDEFALVLTDISSDAKALETGEAILRVLNEPMRAGDETLRVGGSIGVARASDQQRDLSELCKFADQAMFSVKRQENVSVALFDPEKLPARPTLQEKSELQTALRVRSIKPYYQPKIDMLNGSVYGLEALARWEQSDHAVTLPGSFLPKIEELGLLNDLTFSMMRSVLRDIAQWKEHELDPGHVSINLDESTLVTQSHIDDIIFLLRSHPETLEHLTLEVTEDVVLARAGGLVQQSIQRLVDAGARISLDDFGTGFASFQHLRQLSLHEMKIDTSFVTTMGTDPASRVIVEGFLSIAAGLDIDVVAEGVETEEQRDILLSRGCNIGQGFLYSPAVPASHISALLEVARLRDFNSLSF